MANGIKKFNYIGIEDKESQIESFIEQLFVSHPYEVQSVDDANIFKSISGQQIIRTIIESISGEVTVVVENYHIDKSYRDSYYMYFSNQHYQVERYCRRLSFFLGHVERDCFLGRKTDDIIINLEKTFVGTCVIKPVSDCIVGRTLLNPRYFVKKDSAYIRKSKYNVNLYGLTLSVEAFPYQMQDKETMRCSEVTLLNLMDYYSNNYKDYKTVVPSEIIKSEQKYSHERVLPAKGITYHTLTKIMSDFGFSPRLYNLKAMRRDYMAGINRIDEMKRILHYYVESGIPVAVNIDPDNQNGLGHSLLCIGHSSKKSYENAFEKKKYIGNDFEGELAIVNSADFYNEYVVIDDNQFPYAIRPIDELSIYTDMYISNIAVPLYKRMFLEATDAYDIVLMILESDKWGVFKWSSEYLKGEKDIIIRLFLASSRSFKKERSEELGKRSVELQTYYVNIRMPQFVWVCELYSRDGYERKRALGEIVLDGTSAAKKGIRNIILLNYPERMYARNPDQSEKDIDLNMFKVKKWCEISFYEKNLDFI